MIGKLPPTAAYDSSVADRVARLNVMLKRQLGGYSKEKFDLTVVETRLILMLAMPGPNTVNHLANRSDLDRTQISRSIATLIRRDLVHRSPGPVDRREARLRLTKKGAAVHRKILAELVERNRVLISGLPAETLASFFEVMELLIARTRSQLRPS